MNDWIYHYFGVFWLVLIVFGTVIGVVTLQEDFGLTLSAVAGAIGGAGAALILSANRFIAADDVEDDGPPSAR